MPNPTEMPADPPPTNDSALFSVDHLSVQLGQRTILHDLSWSLAEGEILGVIGANGSGKSTLLKSVLDLLPRQTGTIRLAGRELSNYSPNERARQIAYLPQNADCHWPLAVERVVLLGRFPFFPSWAQPRDEDLEAVDQALCAVGIESLRKRPVTELSGGERARVLLARALAGRPSILFADEPAHGLDPYHEMQLMEHFQSHATNFRMAKVVVLHNLIHASRYCHRLLLLAEGKILACGPSAEVLTPENLARAYHIKAQSLFVEGENITLPWSRLPG